MAAVGLIYIDGPMLEILVADVARTIADAVAEEREAIIEMVMKFDSGCRPEYAPDDYIDGYDAGADDFSVFLAAAIRKRGEV